MSLVNPQSNHPSSDVERPPSQRGKRALWVVASVLVLAVAFIVGRGLLSGGGGVGTGVVQMYQCPMHPTVTADKPGDCPICGMKLVPMKTLNAEKIASYHCPMHPTVVSDKPGDCPICGMKLVPMDATDQLGQASQPKTKTMYRSTMRPNEISDKPGKDAMGMDMVPFEVTVGAETSDVTGLAAVSITPQVRQAMGLRLAAVEKREMASEVRTSALITADETRLYHVAIRVDGWIDKLYVSTTGQAVKKGDPLLTLYSPDLLTGQNDYLIALRSKDSPEGSSLISAAKMRLQLWEISDKQIQALENTGIVQRYVTLYSPATGVVTEKDVVAGQKIMPDASLMTIADLTEVWGEADLYQSDIPYVHLGSDLQLSFPYWPDQKFNGKVIFVSSIMDPATRTLHARLEIPNPQGLLKPGMFADATLFYKRGEKLSIPSSAVMFSGTGIYAFKDGGDGRLIPTAIRIGARSDEFYELLDGLNEGDQVVVSANFLVDSESSLRAALEAMTNDAGRAPATTGADTPHQK